MTTDARSVASTFTEGWRGDVVTACAAASHIEMEDLRNITWRVGATAAWSSRVFSPGCPSGEPAN